MSENTLIILNCLIGIILLFVIKLLFTIKRDIRKQFVDLEKNIISTTKESEKQGIYGRVPSISIDNQSSNNSEIVLENRSRLAEGKPALNPLRLKTIDSLYENDDNYMHVEISDKSRDKSRRLSLKDDMDIVPLTPRKNYPDSAVLSPRRKRSSPKRGGSHIVRKKTGSRFERRRSLDLS